MFLLYKLGERSGLFPDDVKGIREFLFDRGIPAGSLEALTHFSTRLAMDPSFQRDVTSLVQVVIQREDEAVDYMDLLGILVAAAAGAGPFDADDEQEESVREILRFLTQIRRPTGGVGPVFVRSQNVVPLVVAAEPLAGGRASLPVRGDHDVAVRPVPSVPFSRMGESTPSRWHGAPVWIAGGMALAVALGSGWLIYQKGRATPQITATLRTVPSSNLPINETDELTMPERRRQKLQVPVIRKPSRVVARHLNSFRAPLAESPMTEHAPLVPPLDAGRSSSPVNLTSSAKPDVIAERNPVTRPLNAAPESARKSTPPVNPTTTSSPSVRRRLPKFIVMNPDFPRRPSRPSESLNASTPGTVHPASIGMMASNLISSPAPAYPAAASQARVQGEVTVRAVVDREGNVIDARMVRGPELLRDVSLEAVQHWHYRPYMQGGKPVEMATTAILDFELP